METEDIGLWFFFYSMGALGVIIFPPTNYLSIVGIGIFALIGFFWFLYFRFIDKRSKTNG